MRPSLSSAFVVAAASLMLVAPVASQTIPSPFQYLDRRQEVGFYVGHMSVGDGRFDFGPPGGLVYGGQYAVELTGPLALQGRVGVVDGRRKVIDPSRDEGDRVLGENDSHIMLIDAAFRFSFTGRRSWHGLSPFILAGAGIALDLLETSSLDQTLLPADVFDFGTSFLGTLGFGTRWFITERIATRFDATFSLWKIDTPPGFSDPLRDFENVEDGEWLAGRTLSATVMYRW